MIRFSLTRLQQQAPYELILSGDSFMFQTDLGIHYSISFMKEDHYCPVKVGKSVFEIVET